jgi:hypothetical protein
VDGQYVPEHIPWEFEEDAFGPMPWIPEGSLVSKHRFYEVRQEQRPKSYSPPPTPPASHNVPPLNALPFPAIIPSSTKGPTLKRAVSFHPGGSQKLRREASVLDGRVTIDTGFKRRPHSHESIVPSSSEPNNMDLIVRQLDAGHQSGLERLKSSMLRLMKAQPRIRRSTVAGNGKHSELSFPTTAPDETRDKIAEEAPHEPLAARRGLPVPSPLELVSTLPIPLASPYHPDIPTPFRGSPSAASPLFESTEFSPTSAIDKRESIGVEDMCINLRYLVSPVISNPADKGEPVTSQSPYPAPGSMRTSDNAAEDAPSTPSEDWNFTSQLGGTFDGDPFSYFDVQDRMPSFIRPLSLNLDVVTESAGVQRSSSSSAISVSTFPEPPVDSFAILPIPSIAISGGGPGADLLSTETRSSFLSSATVSDDNLADSGDSDQTHTYIILGSTETSPRSSEDKDEPLAIRRLALLARSSVMVSKSEGFSLAEGLLPSPSRCSTSLVEGTLKSPTKIVRFAPETEEHTYLAESEAACLLSIHQRPRSSSVPPPQKGSLRNQTFLQRGECKDGRLSRSEPINFPSRIPKKRTFAGIGLSGRHTSIGKRSTEALGLDGRNMLAPAGSENESRKRASSRIPVPGLKGPFVPSSLDHNNTHDGKRTTSRSNRLYVSFKQPSRTPTPQSVPTQQKSSLATSWSMTLRQYVKGSDASGEKRQVLRSPPSRRDGKSNHLPASLVGRREDRKSSLPVKKASFLRGGVSKVTPVSQAHDRTEGQGRDAGGEDNGEGNVVGLVDKTGGISYIAPPKARTTPQSQGRAKDERKGPSTAGTKTLKPVQIRSLLGRLTG